MPRTSKSQWDFGELFTPEQMRHVWTVAELTRKVRSLLETQVGDVWVTGEISNLRVQSSGHRYFTLKDADSQLACVLFRSASVPHRNLLEDGSRVILRGDVTVYEARGQYQLIVRQVELQGLGALQAAFEKLKQQLSAEGLFAPERKQPLPAYSQCIGIVTSPNAAALRDVLHVVQRRNPALQMILSPCRVQGDGAAQEIADAIQRLNQHAAAVRESSAGQQATSMDAILVTRGGGSLEDLWAFNEEVVARAIADSSLPVVSAVGHEIDFTISDFVSDVRAATPSAAAEILTEGVFSAREFIDESPGRLSQAIASGIGEKQDDLERAGARLARLHPRRRLDDGAQRLDDLHESLMRSTRNGLRQAEFIWRNHVDRLNRCRPATVVALKGEALNRSVIRLVELAKREWQGKSDRVAVAAERLRLLGPEQVLARGYSITTDAATGKVLRDAEEVSHGQKLKTQLHKGTLVSRVEK